ncbi:Hsp70 family protein [Rhodococcus sp. KBS0724]|uniref:Hsp70 family protein n=1 Tax=Rhodococcus sp. KBS0724 TaxID=1179674 RepID=UPI00110D7C78|nr:Hsp70 family protein [Rhodococcus sp. KBS0724]TSD48919.1 Hsp70 family protein [Rhodococcus sp. KBS0724]
MNLVLGVTVGASAVRLARPGAPEHGGPVFRSRAIVRGHESPEDVAADSIRVALAEFAGQANSVAVVYRDQTQAGALTQALDRGRINNYRLIPESAAILRMLEEPGTLGAQNTLVVIDLGATGATVDVLDRTTGATIVTARSSQVSGDQFDALVYLDQTERRRIATPTDPEGIAELQARSRLAKEQLSTRSAVCLPGPGGLLLLSREVFDSLVAPSVEALAREVREVIATSGRRPDSVVLIGGGARVPIIRTVLERWIEIPVIAPEQPDLLATQGAALLADGAPRREPVAVPAVTVATQAVAPIFAPYPINTPAAVPAPVQAFTHGGLATMTGPGPVSADLHVPAHAQVAPEPEPLPTQAHPAPDYDGDEPDFKEPVMVDAQAYSAVHEDVSAGQPTWLAATSHDETATPEPGRQFRFAGLGAGVVAAIVIVGLGMGYGGKVFGDSGEAGPVATEVTTTQTPSTTVPTTTTTPPPTTTTEPPPVTEAAPVYEAPYEAPYVPPAPAPAPPPALYIPGLPPILLPVLPPIPGLN